MSGKGEFGLGESVSLFKKPTSDRTKQILSKELSSWKMVSSDSKTPFGLSWSQYVFLLGIADGKER